MNEMVDYASLRVWQIKSCSMIFDDLVGLSEILIQNKNQSQPGQNIPNLLEI